MKKNQPIFYLFAACLFALLGSISTAIYAGSLSREFYDATPCINSGLQRIGKTDDFEGFISENQIFAEFKSSNRNSIIVCRQLGLLHPAVRLSWPSFREPLVFHIGKNISENTKTYLQDTISVWSKAFRDRNSFKISHPVQIFIGNEPRELFALLVENGPKRYEWEDFIAAYGVTCSSTEMVSGFSFFNFVVICINPDLAEIEQAYSNLIETYLHEEFHVVQYQLSGQPEDVSEEVRLLKLGPEWLIEGSAEVLALRVIYGYKELSDQANIRLAELNRPVRLDNIETYGVVVEQGAIAYTNAYLGTFRLIDKRSSSDILAYYQRLGLGQSWQSAFEQSFDLSIEEFYKNIQDH